MYILLLTENVTSTYLCGPSFLKNILQSTDGRQLKAETRYENPAVFHQVRIKEIYKIINNVVFP